MTPGDATAAPLHAAVWAAQLLEELRRNGVDPGPLLAEARLDRAALSGPEARVPFDRCATLFELAAEASGDDSLGFHFGQTRDQRDLGVLAYVGLSAPTVGDAIVNMSRYVRVSSDAVDIDIGDLFVDGKLRWRFRASMTLKRRQHLEFGAAAYLRFLRAHSGREIRPRDVKFIHPRNSNLAEYDRFFGCPVRFGAGENVVRLRLADLALPLLTADDRLHAILLRHCDSVLTQRRQTQSGLVERVERLAVDRLAQGGARIDVVARELAMSPRTLTRRLAEEGANFKGVVDGLRRALAANYLADSDLSLMEIAFLLGYAEISSFTHAHKRWTGETPGQARRRARAAGA